MVRRLLVGLGFCITAGLGQGWTFPDDDDYIRAGLWRATVIDGYIYLDGGEISQVSGSDFYKSYPINDTLSINCSTSWSPEDVEIQNIPRRSERTPVQSKQALLTDKKRNIIHAHGGYFTRDIGVETNDLWSFKVDGEGSGNWQRTLVENPDGFANSTLSEGAAFASATDAGFIFSGAMGRTNFGGYKIFNFTTLEWLEAFDAPYSPDGTLYGGGAVFVEKYGAAGLIIVLGGVQRRFQDPSGYASTGTVYIHDVAEKKWYSQRTSGDETPSGWEQGCVVGVDDTSDNGSFEIFVYGGANVDLEFPEIGTVWALSLPGFVWTKVSDEEDRYRSNHACVAVGSQLISFGGLNLKGDSTENWASKDPYPRGIGIFNLNTHEWEDLYDADRPEYKTHEDIKAWYDDGGMEEVDWSDGVSALFSSQPSDEEETDPEDGEESSAPDPGEEETSSTPVGAIAGGVVGGVAVIAIIGAAIWFFRRRRGQRTSPSELENKEQSRSPNPTKLTPSPSPAVYGGELESNEPHMTRAELPDERSPPPEWSPRSELHGSDLRH